MPSPLLEETIGQMLRDVKCTVAVAESCTGGLVSSRLTDVEGASDFVTLVSAAAMICALRSDRSSRTVALTSPLTAAPTTPLPSVPTAPPQNVVTYSALEKISVLGVTQETVDRYSVTSAECAVEMLQGLRSLTNADFCLSLTGLAGPGGGTAAKPVGLVFIGLYTPRHGCQVFRVQEPPRLTREELKREFSQRALELLRLALCEVANGAGKHVASSRL